MRNCWQVVTWRRFPERYSVSAAGLGVGSLALSPVLFERRDGDNRRSSMALREVTAIVVAGDDRVQRANAGGSKMG